MKPLTWVVFLVLTAAFFVAFLDPLTKRVVSIENDYQLSVETQQQLSADGSTRRQVGLLLAGGFGALLLAYVDRRHFRMNGMLAYAIVFLMVWMAVSVSWSDQPALTIRRVIVMAMLFVAAVAVALRLEPREILLFILFSTTCYLLFGIGVEFVFGTFRPWVEKYRFSGSMHPNNQGMNCSLMLVSGVVASFTEKRFRSLYLGLVILSVAALLMTKSRTSLVSLAIPFAAYMFLVYRGSRHFTYVCFIFLTMATFVVLVAGDTLADAAMSGVLLGRSDQDISGLLSLTGRLPLWQNLLEYVAERPIQGYGYGSFFTVERLGDISARQGWAISQCHSVFLEILVGLGIVGVGAYIIIQFLSIVRSIRYFAITRDARFAYFSTLLLMGVVGGLAESTLLVPKMPTFVQFVVLAYLAFRTPPDAVSASDAVHDRGKFSSPIVHFPAPAARRLREGRV
jgi:O-antigen ligase